MFSTKMHISLLFILPGNFYFSFFNSVEQNCASCKFWFPSPVQFLVRTLIGGHQFTSVAVLVKLSFIASL